MHARSTGSRSSFAGQTPKGKPGKDGPASSRFIYPRPPLRDFTKEMTATRNHQNQSPLAAWPSEGSVPISSEPAPSHRPWISARARPLADQPHLTTRRKRLARLVTFLRDPTTPISVTSLNDLTGRRVERAGTSHSGQRRRVSQRKSC